MRNASVHRGMAMYLPVYFPSNFTSSRYVPEAIASMRVCARCSYVCNCLLVHRAIPVSALWLGFRVQVPHLPLNALAFIGVHVLCLPCWACCVIGNSTLADLGRVQGIIRVDVGAYALARMALDSMYLLDVQLEFWQLADGPNSTDIFGFGMAPDGSLSLSHQVCHCLRLFPPGVCNMDSAPVASVAEVCCYEVELSCFAT
jgi:hypothetical protein